MPVKSRLNLRALISASPFESTDRACLEFLRGNVASQARRRHQVGRSGCGEHDRRRAGSESPEEMGEFCTATGRRDWTARLRFQKPAFQRLNLDRNDDWCGKEDFNRH